MPSIPKHPCAHPGCPRLVARGVKYCEEHAGMHPEIVKPDERKSAYRRGYTKQWQRASKLFLQEHPLCAICLKEGRVTPATVVDHIRPHRGDMGLFWDVSNWQSLCKPCHDRKTAKEDMRVKYSY